MLKRLLLLIALVHNLSLLTGCSSSDSAEEGTEAAAATDEASGEEAEESEEGEETATKDEEEEEDEESEVAEEDGEESAEEEGEETATKEEEEEEEGEDVVADGEEDDVEDLEPTAEAKEEPKAEVAEAAPAEPTFNDTAMSEPAMDAPAGIVPVRKIKDTPYTVGGVLANAVYLARPGDTVESISEKIYGMDKTANIYKVNPNLRNGVKTGDKVYYNSPLRPQDENRMMVYYEDAGAGAQTYVSKDGDNIRKVSKELLAGDDNSWKEVWATNMSVDSKNELPAGTELRYWPAGAAPAAPAAPVAPSEPPPIQLAENTEAPETPASSSDIPPPPPPTSDIPSDVVANTNSSQDNIDIPPPPPPAPPAPEESMRTAKKTDDGSSIASLMEDPQNMMIIGGAIFAIIALVGIAFTKKRRSRIDFGQTQV